MPRAYRLGQRQPAVEATARSIVAAARQLLQERASAEVSLSAVARRAGVSRITVYNRFGSRDGLLRALAVPPATSPPMHARGPAALRLHLETTCARWAADPALFRHLPSDESASDSTRVIAERLAAEDALRPGCSLREAEDVISALSSFAVFDRLHRDGRRSPAAVAEVLMRMASGILT